MATHEWYERQRQIDNDRSRTWATHHAEPWTEDETDLVMLWDGSNRADLEDLSELLGRTMLACEQRYFSVRSGRKGRGRVAARVTYTTTTTTTTTTEHCWDPEDDPNGWYVKG